MTVKAWRIVKAKHAAAAFGGLGAKLAGGRWNSAGVAVVYTAGSLALGMLEMLVHVQREELLRRYVTFEVAFDESLVTPVELADLPHNWRRSPSPAALRGIGDDWIAGRTSPVLRVPSAVVPAEFNYLLNPNHADFDRIRIGPKRAILLDSRLSRG